MKICVHKIKLLELDEIQIEKRKNEQKLHWNWLETEIMLMQK